MSSITHQSRSGPGLSDVRVTDTSQRVSCLGVPIVGNETMNVLLFVGIGVEPFAL